VADRFAAFYKATFSEVYAYLFHRCGGNQAVAEELTQETYLAAVAAFKSQDPEEPSLPWLIGVARHKLIDHFRKQEREERRLSLVMTDDSLRAIAITNGRISRERALTALASVPAAQRAALVLRYLDDLPVPKIAGVLNRSIHATESLLARGRNNLKRRYREADE
jgi:RNA polymerase sigma-70 factor (ECF subfamily)